MSGFLTQMHNQFPVFMVLRNALSSNQHEKANLDIIAWRAAGVDVSGGRSVFISDIIINFIRGKPV